MIQDFNTQIINFLFKGVPECVALTMLTLSILKLQFDWKKIFITALVVDTIVLLIRMLILSTSLHTALAILSMALLIAFLFKISKLNSIVATIISMLVLSVYEFANFYLFKTFFDLDIYNLAQNDLFWIANSWVNTSLIALTSLLINHINKYRRSNSSKFK